GQDWILHVPAGTKDFKPSAYTSSATPPSRRLAYTVNGRAGKQRRRRLTCVFRACAGAPRPVTIWPSIQSCGKTFHGLSERSRAPQTPALAPFGQSNCPAGG